jgi:hypothetical protein
MRADEGSEGAGPMTMRFVAIAVLALLHDPAHAQQLPRSGGALPFVNHEAVRAGTTRPAASARR